jgi:hypothetical protein
LYSTSNIGYIRLERTTSVRHETASKGEILNSKLRPKKVFGTNQLGDQRKGRQWDVTLIYGLFTDAVSITQTVYGRNHTKTRYSPSLGRKTEPGTSQIRNRSNTHLGCDTLLTTMLKPILNKQMCEGVF